MPNHLKFCSCRSCRKGRHRPGNKAATRRKVRGQRRAAKQDLRAGKEPPPTVGGLITD